MKDRSTRIAKTIRMREETYHRARVAAVISRKTLGQWIEEAVEEKVQRESVNPPVRGKLPASDPESAFLQAA